jgi:hypothetical protein
VGVQRANDRPRVLGALCYIFGYGEAALRRAPRAEPAVRRAVRRDTLRRLRRRAIRLLRGSGPTEAT